MSRFTERHFNVAVIKDKNLLPKAMEKLARIEDMKEQGCNGCIWKESARQLLPCRKCVRNDMEDMYERANV